MARYEAGDGDLCLKRRFEELTGEPCLVLHMSQAKDEPMRRLAPGKPQIGGVAATTAGWFCEPGYYCVDAVQPDPLFAGLPDPFVVRESHYCEIESLPVGRSCSTSAASPASSA